MHISEGYRDESSGFWTVFIVYCLAFASYGENSGGIFILGFVMNYALQSKSANTWVESHHLWQMKTVKMILKGLAVCFILMFPVFVFKEVMVLKLLFYIALPIAYFIGFLFFYRSCKGMFYLIQRKPIHNK